jgi:hypothetical protein
VFKMLPVALMLPNRDFAMFWMLESARDRESVLQMRHVFLLIGAFPIFVEQTVSKAHNLVHIVNEAVTKHLPILFKSCDAKLNAHIVDISIYIYMNNYEFSSIVRRATHRLPHVCTISWTFGFYSSLVPFLLTKTSMVTNLQEIS